MSKHIVWMRDGNCAGPFEYVRDQIAFLTKRDAREIETQMEWMEDDAYADGESDTLRVNYGLIVTLYWARCVP